MSGAVSRGENTDAGFFMSLSRCSSTVFKGKCATSMRKTPDFRVRAKYDHHAEFLFAADFEGGMILYNRDKGMLSTMGNQGCDSMGAKDGGIHSQTV